MIVNKSDQIHQPLLSDTPIQNTNSSNIDQGDNSQGLPQQEELSLTKKSQQLEIFQSSKDIYDFDINSEKEFQPVNCLLEPQNQTEVLIQSEFIQNKTQILYLVKDSQTYFLRLRDLQTNSQIHSIQVPLCFKRGFYVLNDGQYIYSGSEVNIIRFYTLEEIFKSTYNNGSFKAQHCLQITLEMDELFMADKFQLIENYLFFQIVNKAKTLQNPVDQEYVVFFVGFEFDINGSQVTSDLQNPSSLIWDLNEITKKYKQIYLENKSPISVTNISNSKFKGFFTNSDFTLRSVHDNFIIIREVYDLFLIDFDLQREDSRVFTAIKPLNLKHHKVIKQSGIIHGYEEVSKEYRFYLQKWRISFQYSNSKSLKLKKKGEIKNLPQGILIEYLYFHEKNQILYIVGNRISISANQLIMVDFSSMLVVNELTLTQVKGSIQQIVISDDLKNIYIATSKNFYQVFPYYAASNQVENFIIPHNFSSQIAKCSEGATYKTDFKIIDDRFLLLSHKTSTSEVIVQDMRSCFNKQQMFSLGQIIKEVVYIINNNQEVVFFPIDRDELFIAQIDLQNKRIKNSMALLNRNILSLKVISIQTHNLHPSCIFIAQHTSVIVIKYDFLQQSNEIIYHKEHKDIRQFFMLNNSFAFVIRDQNNAFKLIEQSLDFSKEAIEYEFIRVENYVMNNERSLIFITQEKDSNIVQSYDLINKCFVESLTFKLGYKEELKYFSFNEIKNQLVVRTDTSGRAYILTIHNFENNWEYSSKITLVNFYEHKFQSKISYNFQQYNDQKTNKAQLFLRNTSNKVIKNLRSTYGDTFNEDQFKIDYFLINGFQEQHLPVQRIDIDYLNQKYNIYCDIEQQNITFIQQKFSTNDLTTLISLKNLDDLEIILKLSNIGDFTNLLMHYPKIGNLLQIVAFKPRVLQFLIKYFEVQNKANLPILMLFVQGESPLDKAIKKNQIKCIIYLLEILVKFQNHFVFNHFIDSNLISLIEKNINLNDYFESNLPIIKINHKNFPDLHFDDSELILGLGDVNNPKDIIDKYDSIFSDHLDSQNQDEQQKPIEYYLINLPETLTKMPRKLMEVLSESETMELFEILTIQTIINFKWNSYTKNFFQTQFNLFLIFCLSFIFEVLYALLLTDRRSDPIIDERNMIVLYSLKTISVAVLIYFFIYEIKQATRQDNYLKEIWNFFDYSLIVLYILLISLEALNPYEDYIIIIKIVIVFLTFLKINFFLRIYDGFSFLVSMMAAVFVDLKYFMGFFVIFILQFGLIFAILFDAINIEEYQGIGIFAYLMMAFRTSSGDFNVDSYKDQSSTLVIISWAIWIIAVMLLNVMFMNFIIAVISESYEKVMQKLVAESYRVKVQMIVERELHFSDEELLSQKYFPKFLILRRPVSSSENQNGEWQGFVKDLKSAIKTSNQKQSADIQYEIQSRNEQLKKEISENQKSLKCNQESIIKKVDTITVNAEAQKQRLVSFEKMFEIQDKKIEKLNIDLGQFILEQKQYNETIVQLLQNKKPKDAIQNNQ